MDVEQLVSGDRQIQLISFALFVVANLGIFGAALVLAAPLAGGIFLIVSAVAWATAAAILKSSLYVILTPPALLLVGAALAIVARIRAPRGFEMPRRRQTAMAASDGLDMADSRSSQADDGYGVPGARVGAGFFGQGGTAMPLQPQQPDDGLGGLSQSDQMRSDPGDWRPGSRRPPPPRQKRMFRDDDEEDDEDEESGFSRFARSLSGVLSFGLYAALAGAAVLIIWNVRTGELGRPAAAKVEASSVAVAANIGPQSSAPASPSASAPAAPVLSSAEPGPSVAAADAQTPPASGQEPVSLVSGIQQNRGLGGVVVQDGVEPPPRTLTADASSNPESTASSVPPSSASEQPASDTSTAPTTGGLMPFTTPAAMAAERMKPAPKPTQTTTTSRPATPPADAGL
jgi:hypothetical protein